MTSNPFNTADLTDGSLPGNGADDADARDFNGKHNQTAGPEGQAQIQPMEIASASDDNGDGEHTCSLVLMQHACASDMRRTTPLRTRSAMHSCPSNRIECACNHPGTHAQQAVVL